jgi:hypothetical protein
MYPNAVHLSGTVEVINSQGSFICAFFSLAAFKEFTAN